ncbi:MAG: SDR family oxidoreductase [Myxococcales bacterium]|nr:SDR family oxidoreductase [Myxococcales bacterium]
MDTQLRDLVVVITGASGGIGWACAEAFAAEGARLVLHAHRAGDELERRVAASTWGERAITLRGDLRDESTNEDLLRRGRERFGRVDVAVLSAGIWPPEPRPLWELDLPRIREVLDTNLLAVILGARAFLRGLAAAGPRSDGRGASLCLIGSTAGRFGEAGHSEYATSKAALVGLMLSLKNEIVRLDPYGRVNLVEPGWTVTEMARPALAEPGLLPRVLSTMPLRQLARPEDIARAVAINGDDGYIYGAGQEYMAGQFATLWLRKINP